MSFRFPFYFLLSLILLACHSQEDVDSSEIRTVKMAEMSRDIRLPSQLWDKLFEAGFEESVKKGSNFSFAPISVLLEEKNPGVLSDPKIRLEFQKAGGEVDFAKFVKSDKGTFKVSFDFEGLAEPESLRIFFVSNAKKRKIGEEVFGSGCNEFYEIKDFLTKVNSKEGLLVNVTHFRHDSALGGHVVFSYKKNKQLYISQVTFTDSKIPSLFCD